MEKVTTKHELLYPQSSKTVWIKNPLPYGGGILCVSVWNLLEHTPRIPVHVQFDDAEPKTVWPSSGSTKQTKAFRVKITLTNRSKKILNTAIYFHVKPLIIKGKARELLQRHLKQEEGSLYRDLYRFEEPYKKRFKNIVPYTAEPPKTQKRKYFWYGNKQVKF